MIDEKKKLTEEEIKHNPNIDTAEIAADWLIEIACGIKKQIISKARLTPRETTVMSMVADGLSVREIFESGKVVALYRKRGGPVCEAQVSNIKNKAIRKMKNRGLITHD